MSSPRRPLHRAAGFTFIELLVVIAIIGLMSGIIVANLDRMSVRGRLASAARSLGNQILQLKDTAALQQRETFLEIDLGNAGRWRVVDVPSPMDVPDPEEREEETYYGAWYELPDAVFVDSVSFSRSDVDESGVLTISFSADGELSPSGFVAYLRHEELPEQEGVSVEVTGLTGLVAYHTGKVVAEEVRDSDDF